MSRTRSIAAILAVFVLASVAESQPSPTLEIGLTSDATHHPYRYRYPGERAWERSLGARADLRIVRTAAGVIGLTAAFDRYGYVRDLYVCLPGCTNDVARSGAASSETRIPTHDVWNVSRLAFGATLDRQIAGALHANAGVLGGETRRTPDGGLAADDYNQFTKLEWFAGVEAGLTLRWRDLALGVGAEYGRVPKTEYARKPYYGRFTTRVAYAFPLGGNQR